MSAAPAPRARLVLFDIDGTLLSGGLAARSVFAAALTEVFGTCGDIDTFAFEGKLDPMIIRDLLVGAGVPEETVLSRRAEALEIYLDRLEEALALERPVLKPGVAAVLEGVARSAGAVPALLTGNVERGARIKLSAVGLWHLFAFGAFGDEAPRREELGPIALAKARRLGFPFEGSDCVVVGDAPQDVACALALGARIVAVATGKTPAGRLAEAGAHVVLPDLSDTPRALEAILG
ncbi:MAG TPA: HAD family hydrolase [Thermoanaerobaculia bacterium]|nr:HAD family hydrolase [Thermoanaerobaculia bacterium]